MPSNIENMRSGEGRRREIVTEFADFPSDPMERLGIVLAGAVNTGVKSGLMLQFPPYGEYVDAKELAASFRNSIGFTGTPFDSIAANVVDAYCQHSFVNVGLMARTLEMNSGGVPELLGYTWTEPGAIYGPRAAAVGLLFEYFHDDIGIYEVFGHTATSSENDVRAAFVRSEIMLKLFDNPDGLLLSELYKNNPHMGAGTVHHAISLFEKYGLVSRTTSGVTNELHFSRGAVTKKDVVVPEDRKVMYQDVLSVCDELLSGHKLFTIKDIAEHLYPKYSPTWNELTFKQWVRSLVRDMVSQHYLNRVDATGAISPGDVVRLTDEGKDVTKDLVLPLLGLLSDDSEMIDMIDHNMVPLVLDNYGKVVRNAIERYYPHSQGYLGHMTQQIDSRVLELIMNAGVLGLDRKDLAEIMNEKPQTIEKRIGRLMRANQICVTPGEYRRKRYTVK